MASVSGEICVAVSSPLNRGDDNYLMLARQTKRSIWVSGKYYEHTKKGKSSLPCN